MLPGAQGVPGNFVSVALFASFGIRHKFREEDQRVRLRRQT
jgi:hypothetical protein